MDIKIKVDNELYKKFKAALILNEEDEQTVLNELISDYSSIIFKRTLDEKNINNKNITTNINASDQKDLFINWFTGLTKNGKKYNNSTINCYVSRIKNSCSERIFDSIPFNNLFEIQSLNDFIKIERDIKECDGFNSYNEKLHNSFNAALKKYEEFLKSQCNANHKWNIDEDIICCKKFIEYYIVEKSDITTSEFIKIISNKIPNIKESSIKMKIENIKYISEKSGYKDSSHLKGLANYSKQNEIAFNIAKKELNL